MSGAAPLTIQLQKADGTVIETGTIDAAAIGTDYSWVDFDFSTAQVLHNGSAYNLTLQAPASAVFECFPIRKGSSSNVAFSPSTYFSDGYAQFTTDGTWQDGTMSPPIARTPISNFCLARTPWCRPYPT